jgi:hypothetical protein
MRIKSRRMRWVEHVAHMAEKKSGDKTLVIKRAGKKFLRRKRNN